MLCLYTCTYVPWYVPCMWYVRTYVRTQLSDWKGAHMCTENHLCFGRTHATLARQPVERGSECRATHTYSLATALTPLPQWRGLPRGVATTMFASMYVGLDTNQSLHHPLSTTSWGDGPLKYHWVRESAAGRTPGTPVGCPGRGGPACCVRTYHGTYMCTNITLSQKQLEIQALRFNRETRGRYGIPGT